jgi:hypothetical protein
LTQKMNVSGKRVNSLYRTQDRESGGFSAWASVKQGGGMYSGVLLCLTGNMVWSLIRLGLLDD